jgi:hypothetical protein
MSGNFKAGDLVLNKNIYNDIDKEKDSIGVLISESDIHPSFWDVLASGDLMTWYETNLKKIEIEKK